MSTWEVAALKENTQLRLFGALSAGCFFWSVILTSASFLWVLHFSPLKQIKEGFVSRSLTVTAWMLTQSWYFFRFKLSAFSPSSPWSLWSMLSCTPCVETITESHEWQSQYHVVCMSAPEPISYEPLLDDSTHLQQVTFLFPSLFLISANINNEKKFTCVHQEAQPSLIYLQ